jgi:D-alanyl-D-alanine carboxypeptidase (penicillin-binding protein 5/6)
MRFKNFYWYFIGLFVIVGVGNFALVSSKNNTQTLDNLGVLHHIKILNMLDTQVKVSAETLTPAPIVRFNKIDDSAVDPVITAKSALVLDFETGDILYNKNALDRHQLASITKVLSTMVVIDEYKWGSSKYLTMSQTAFDTYGGDSLKVGEKFTTEDILKASLMVSSNDATELLAESFGGVDNFIAKMNQKAQNLNMKDSQFSNPHGLDQKPISNYSTASDIMKLTKNLYDKYPDLIEVLKQKEVIIKSQSGQNIRIGNTNEMLGIDEAMIAGKTGLTDEAGETFASVVSIKNRAVGIVVLESGIGGYRFQDTRNLIKWVEANYRI